MYEERTRKTRFSLIASIAAATTALLLATSAMSMITTENAFAEKYRNNQASAGSNFCLNPIFESSTLDIVNNIGNCGNTISQQEESGQASSPVTSQIASPTIEVQSAAPPPTPEPQTCLECFTAFLTANEIALFEQAFSDFTMGEITTIEELCPTLEVLNDVQLQQALGDIAILLTQTGIDQPRIDDIINCLERVFGL